MPYQDLFQQEPSMVFPASFEEKSRFPESSERTKEDPSCNSSAKPPLPLSIGSAWFRGGQFGGRVATNLCEAAWQNDLATFRDVFITQRGSAEAISRCDVRGFTPFHYAAGYGNSELAAFLLRNQSAIERRDNQGNTPLLIAASEGHEELVSSLIDVGANCNCQNFEGDTALHFAASRGYLPVAKLLLQHGANPNHTNLTGATPLHAASAMGHQAIIQLLARYGGFLNGQDEEGETPLHWAIREDKLEAVECLVKLGADVRACNEDGESLLEFAQAVAGNQFVVAFLEANGAAATTPPHLDLATFGEAAIPMVF